LLLKAVSYSKYGWKICGDLKAVGSLLGMQSAYIKFCCFLCEWDSRAKDAYYKIKDLAHARKLSSWGKHVRNLLLVDKERFCYSHYTLN
jgi:hypothetical protein